MKVIRIIDRSAGNESVGEMWQDTEIFDMEQPIKELFRAKKMPFGDSGISFYIHSRKTNDT